MIWCVEDDASIRDIELYALTSTGFEARGFDDGASFWEALQTETPELVLLDVMLPGEDGVSLLKRMKTVPALRDIIRHRIALDIYENCAEHNDPHEKPLLFASSIA